ncbi:MAG: ATP-binding protein [Actinobacteria bacterium]|nr:ATP-binding protein [Actinomycetota bacterium]
MVITVAAGKGGTGKTLVAVNLALSLQRSGIETTLVDADVEEPNDHLFVKPAISGRREVTVAIPRVDEGLCDRCGECSSFCAYGALATTPDRVIVFDDLCHGCGGCALICPAGAISEVERVIGTVEEGRTGEGMGFMQGLLEIGEPKATPIISSMKEGLDPHRVNVVDCGPGTGCAVMGTVHGSDVCVMVTEPTPFGLHDLDMAVRMAAALGVPSLVVVNKDIPGETEVRRFCAERGLEIALSIPFSLEIARLTSSGVNLADSGEEWRRLFLSLYERTASLARSGGD